MGVMALAMRKKAQQLWVFVRSCKDGDNFCMDSKRVTLFFLTVGEVHKAFPESRIPPKTANGGFTGSFSQGLFAQLVDV